MTTAAAVLDAIRGYLGVAENPAHSNQTVIGEKFGWNGVPWCAETVTVCQHEAGNTAFQGSASCSQLVERYQDGTNGAWLGNPGAGGLEPGDEFFMGSRGQDHTGLVESVDGDTVHSVEGNYADKVARVSRPATAFFGFGRPHYDDPAPAQGDDEVIPQDQLDQIIKEIRDNAIAVAEDVKSTKSDVIGADKRIDQVNVRLDAQGKQLDEILTLLKAK